MLRMGSLKEEIAKRNATFCEYVRAGNVAGISKLYTEDAHLMPSNTPAIVGREGIKEFWGSFASSQGVKDASLTTVQLVGEGDQVTEYGEYKLKFAPEGREAGEDKGKYMVLWKKTDEGWQLHWDMFNTNLPAPK